MLIDHELRACANCIAIGYVVQIYSKNRLCSSLESPKLFEQFNLFMTLPTGIITLSRFHDLCWNRYALVLKLTFLRFPPPQHYIVNAFVTFPVVKTTGNTSFVFAVSWLSKQVQFPSPNSKSRATKLGIRRRMFEKEHWCCGSLEAFVRFDSV